MVKRQRLRNKQNWICNCWILQPKERKHCTICKQTKPDSTTSKSSTKK